MPPISQRLQEALDAEESGELDAIIREHKQSDLDELRQLVSPDPSIDPMHRTRAIYALGRWGDQESVPRMISVLPHLDEIGAIAAVDALGRLETSEAMEAVTGLTEHNSPHVRKFVVKALGRSSRPEARNKLSEIQANDPAEFVRNLARERISW
jgi:HEAT repeat protein